MNKVKMAENRKTVSTSNTDVSDANTQGASAKTVERKKLTEGLTEQPI